MCKIINLYFECINLEDSSFWGHYGVLLGKAFLTTQRIVVAFLEGQVVQLFLDLLPIKMYAWQSFRHSKLCTQWHSIHIPEDVNLALFCENLSLALT